ncbi:MAG: hypothetical protein EKK35_08220 [Bradyrhizobiaceae bacterium]|nr:MAG: hypothetical protein EKK35_08220 [Bradyrhizobiaceae bacterium]
MTALVVPFPLARREEFIKRHARYAASIRPEAAERYIERQLKHQADTMLRRGIGVDTIAAELASMHGAIRAALWDEVLRPIGGPT